MSLYHVKKYILKRFIFLIGQKNRKMDIAVLSFLNITQKEEEEEEENAQGTAKSTWQLSSCRQKWFFSPSFVLVDRGNCMIDGEIFAWKWQALGILHETDKPSSQPPQLNRGIVRQFLLVYTFGPLAFSGGFPCRWARNTETDLSRARLLLDSFSLGTNFTPLSFSLLTFSSLSLSFAPRARMSPCKRLTD